MQVCRIKTHPNIWAFCKGRDGHLGTIMPTINVHKYFVIATNYPTKWAELQPMVLKDYELIAQFFFDKIPMQYACPQKILSDNAPN